jgi:hypothetical protein
VRSHKYAGTLTVTWKLQYCNGRMLHLVEPSTGPGSKEPHVRTCVQCQKAYADSNRRSDA